MSDMKYQQNKVTGRHSQGNSKLNNGKWLLGLGVLKASILWPSSGKQSVAGWKMEHLTGKMGGRQALYRIAGMALL